MKLGPRTLVLSAVSALALFALAYYTKYLMEDELKHWRPYKATFKRTLGLKKKDDVFDAGFKIGRVKDVRLEGDHHVVELEVEPDIVFQKKELAVEIQSVDPFGDAAVFVSYKTSEPWPEDKPIPGKADESFSESDQSTLQDRIREGVTGVQEATAALTRVEEGLGSRLLNDADLSTGFRDGIKDFDTSVRTLDQGVASTDSGEGLGGLISPENAFPIRESVRSLNETVTELALTLGEANQGEGGFLGRLAGDPALAESTRGTIENLKAILKGYDDSDPGFAPFFLSNKNDPIDDLRAQVGWFNEAARNAYEGEGALGGFFGITSGESMRAEIQGVDEGLTTARDPSGGIGWLNAPASRDRFDDAETSIENVLHEVRRALRGFRSEQGPNTFQGAILAIF